MSYDITAIGDEADAARAAAKVAPTDPAENGTQDPAEQVQEQQQEQQQQEQADVTTEGDKQEEVVDEAAEPEYYYGGEAVSVEIPEDLQASLDEKGIDAKALVAELFAKDGDFSLSAETRAKLDEAFGKGLVDGYLNLYKGQNEMAFKQLKADAEAQQAVLVQNTETFNTLVGGDEGWTALSTFAASSLSEAELASVNAVMALPTEHWDAQRMVVEMLKTRFDAAQKESNSDHIRLVTDEGAPAESKQEGAVGDITRQQYHQIMMTDRYKKDQAYQQQVDNARRASITKGL